MHGGYDDPAPCEAKAFLHGPAEDAGLHVPGTGASPVDVRKIWLSLPRWILSTRTSLATFLRSFLGNQPWKHRGTASALWPIAAPYPHLFLGKHSFYERGDLARMRAVNIAVLVLSWLHLGKPARCPGSLSLHSHLSDVQWKIVRRLESFFDEVEKVGVVGPEQMGRSAAKVEGLENLLFDLQSQAE